MKKAHVSRLARCVSAFLVISFPLVVTGHPARVEPSAPGMLSDRQDLRARLGATEGLLPALIPPAERIDRAYGALPLSFEVNKGQTDGRVRFMSRGGDSTVFLTATEAVMVLTKRQARQKPRSLILSKTELAEPPAITRTAVRMQLVGVNPAPQALGLDALPGKVNYFIGNDPAKWRTNIETYARVEFRDVYPGVNLVYYGNQRQLEYDFVVAPGANPDRIQLSFRGAEKMELDSHGNLLLHTSAGVIHQRKPVIYQAFQGGRREISGGYVVKGTRTVGFHLAAYDVSRPLIIDPVISYSTLLGASSIVASAAIAVDTTGNIYVAGFTDSSDFPTTAGVLQPVGSSDVNGDAFVSKLNPTGSALIYSTYLGGGDQDAVAGLVVDAMGNAYVGGSTGSTDFPTTAGAFQPTSAGRQDVFVAKLNSSGSALVYSTYFGGGEDDQALDFTVDAAGNTYVTGVTQSNNLPTTVGAFQTTFGGVTDAFVAKINPTGSSLIYATYLGGSSQDDGFGIAVDAQGSAYVTGLTYSTNFPATAGAFQGTLKGECCDAFVTKFDATGTLVYSTYLGSSGIDSGAAIAVDAGGNAYVTGSTGTDLAPSFDFPTTPGAFQTASANGFGDAFVTKINPTGSGLVYSTYLGGTGVDGTAAIVVDAAGNAYVIGGTDSSDFPTTAGSFQTTFAGGTGDAFVTKLNPTGSNLVYSTYLGGDGEERGLSIFVDQGGHVYVAGSTGSTNFPTTVGVFQTARSGIADAFVAKISDNTPTGANISVSAGNGATVTFTSVSNAGETAAPTSATGPTPPANFSVGPLSYYAIATTATFGGPITICIAYAPTLFNDATTLRMFHFESGVWTDVTTSNDPVAGLICGQTTSLSPFLLADKTPLTVGIDIKPGSYPNTINLGSNGVTSVAILSSPTFDARTVDPMTVTLASAPVKLKGKGQSMATVQDVNGDGRPDLVVKVETDALELNSSDTSATLKGRTFSGQPIKGTDSVRIVPQ